MTNCKISQAEWRSGEPIFKQVSMATMPEDIRCQLSPSCMMTSLPARDSQASAVAFCAHGADLHNLSLSHNNGTSSKT